MQFASVNTKNEPLQVYADTYAIMSQQTGSLNTGSIVKVLETKDVNGVTWAKISSDNIEGWVIQQHPSLSYSFLKETEKSRSLNDLIGGIGGTIGNVSDVILGGSGSIVSAAIGVIGTAATKFFGGGTQETDEERNAEVYGPKELITVVDSSSSRLNPGGTKRETTGNVSMLDGTWSSVEVTPDPPKKLTLSGRRTNPMHDLQSSKLPPHKVQNDKGYPRVKYYDKGKKLWVYDYTTDYTDKTISGALSNLRRSINLDVEDLDILFERQAKFYNRFKIANPDEFLSRTFHHVFFTRPDCNIITSTGSGNYKLAEQVESRSNYQMEFKNNKLLLCQLSENIGLTHSFMMLPSNKVLSFECKDRTIDTNTYGKNYFGYGIAYGKTMDESLAANEVTIGYSEDRSLHMLKLHQYWVEYISNVKKGLFEPKDVHKYGKDLDYAASAYYIVTDMTGENIIYWSKLYGIFPLTVPDSSMAMNEKATVSNPTYSIPYRYSMKKDCDVNTVLEFNLCSIGTAEYLASYDRNLMSTGYTWVGAPFIETVVQGKKTLLKLRFRPN